MAALSRTVQIGGLVLLASVSLGVMLFVFEFHYMWFLRPSQAWALRVGFAVGVVSLIALWAFFPSYWAVIVVGAIIFAFPVFAPDMRPSSLSLRLAIAMSISIAFLIATTALRRYWFPIRE